MGGSRSRQMCGPVLHRAPNSATLKQAVEPAGMSRTTGHLWLSQSGGVRPRLRRRGRSNVFVHRSGGFCTYGGSSGANVLSRSAPRQLIFDLPTLCGSEGQSR